jgi:hypothetical protein
MEEEVGERSRSSSECSELEEEVDEDQEERLTDVIKGGRGGTRGAESSGERSYGLNGTSSSAVTVR